MHLPFDYAGLTLGEFGGTTTVQPDFDAARVIIVPIPLDRTTSYLSGTRAAPREILTASSHMELWDEETKTDVHGVGLCTLPEMDFQNASLENTMAEIERVGGEVVARGKFPIVLGGEHSITAPVVAALRKKYSDLSVLQIDAHADLRDSYMGTKYSHACAMRRVLEHARLTQVGIRSLSTEEAAAIPSLPTTVFYDFDMRRQTDWIDRIVQTLTDPVYITIDCDGLDPAIMPAVGTPEPGGLNWQETLALLKAVMGRRLVVGCDLVELCPVPGLVAPNFLCAKLIYKILSYRFCSEVRR